MRTDRLLASSLALAVASAAHAQTHVFVDDDAPAGGDGLSWNTAFSDLHDAIDLANQLGQNRGEIRIAGGTYTPDQGTGDRTMAFVIQTNQAFVAPYKLTGGYAGLSDPGNPDARDTDVYRSVLDGDLLGNDTAGSDSRLDNSENLFVVGDGSSSNFTTLSGVSLEGIEFNGASVGAVRGTVSAVSLSFRGCGFTNNRGGAGSVMKFVETVVIIDECFVAHNVSTIPVGGSGGGSLDFDRCRVNIRDSVFENNSSGLLSGSAGDAHGGAISSRLGWLEISGSRFRNNRSHTDGGAVFLSNVWANITDTEFLFNSSNVGNIHDTGRGGGVYATSGDVRIERCEFTNNFAQRGGAVYCPDGMLIKDTVFQSNIAVTGGAFGGIGNVEDCEFSLNIASSGGGAIDIGDNASASDPVIISYSMFESNVTLAQGGAIRDSYDDDVGVFVTGCEFRQNTSRGLAGAVFGCDEIIGSVFEGNSAGTSGGAVFSVPLVASCEFIDNTAETGWGGGTFGVPTILGSSFTGNSARLGGGGAHNPVFVEACSFVGNTARDGGGAIILLDGGEVTIQDSVFADNISEQNTSATEIHKDGDSALTLIRSSLAGTQDNGPPMLSLAGGQTWIESSTIWNEAWEGSPIVVIEEGSPLALVHTNLRMEPEALVVSNPNDLFFFGGNMSGNPRYTDAAAGDLRLRPGSPLIDAGFVFGSQDGAVTDVYGGSRDPFDDLGMVNIGQGANGYLDIGAAEFRGESCFADVNGDGALTSTDFTAWIAAFGDGDAVADQNRDRVLTPSDFTAWINNFNAGCP